eukprot:1069767-Amphidinium_carterae.1
MASSDTVQPKTYLAKTSVPLIPLANANNMCSNPAQIYVMDHQHSAPANSRSGANGGSSLVL